ncbi:MAG TPA: hypothetical protein VK099_01175 [Alcanivoracaceae bacterium]|nr:hypothetical protein [Alcanivoracaceae bacterium]
MLNNNKKRLAAFFATAGILTSPSVKADELSCRWEDSGFKASKLLINVDDKGVSYPDHYIIEKQFDAALQGGKILIEPSVQVYYASHFDQSGAITVPRLSFNLSANILSALRQSKVEHLPNQSIKSSDYALVVQLEELAENGTTIVHEAWGERLGKLEAFSADDISSSGLMTEVDALNNPTSQYFIRVKLASLNDEEVMYQLQWFQLPTEKIYGHDSSKRKGDAVVIRKKHKLLTSNKFKKSLAKFNESDKTEWVKRGVYCEKTEQILEDCYLTTATVHCVGLTDNCWELEQLRRFRDRFKTRGEYEHYLVEQYYITAPHLVSKINSLNNAKSIWLNTWLLHIVPAALAAQLRLDNVVYALYQRMATRLARIAGE